MADYLHRFDATPAAERWPLVRRWMSEEPRAFFDELRRNRPVLATPAVTLAVRFSDCRDILLRHDIFSVALYKPKQGDYWMAQDDTAVHRREKSIMQAVLDREDIPKIRAYVADKAAALIAAAPGEMDIVAGLTRAVPIALVQDWFACRQRSGGAQTLVLLEPDGRVLESAFRRDRRARPEQDRCGARGRQRSHARLPDRPDSAPGRRASGRTRRDRSGFASIGVVSVEGAEIRPGAGGAQCGRIVDRRGRDDVSRRGQRLGHAHGAARRSRRRARSRRAGRSGRGRRLRVRSIAVQSAISVFLPRLRAGHRLEPRWGARNRDCQGHHRSCRRGLGDVRHRGISRP